MDLARVLRVLAVRPGEGRLVAGVAAMFALLEGARGFGEVAADALVLARLGPDALPTALPYLFIGLGLTSFVLSLAYAVALGRVARTPLFVGIVTGIAALLVAERIGLAAGVSELVPVIWLTVFAASAINLTIAWTVSGAAFDARQAKRLFPLLTSAAIAGSFVGTLVAGPIARLTSVETLIVVQAVLLVAAAILLTRLPRPRARPALAGPARSVGGDLRAGFDAVARSPLMRLVALAYVLLAVLLFSVSFPFLLSASRQFPDSVELATALGLLSTAITATSFVLSLTVANRLYARLGVTAGALALPLIYVVGFATWLLQFSFATAAAFRFAQQATQRGVSNAAWSAFYNVVPAERRAQVLGFMDGVPGQAGTVLSGVLLLIAANLRGLEPVFALGLVTAVVATVVVLGIRRRYADSLLAALRSGLAEQVLEGNPGLPAGLERPDVRGALVSALDDPEPGLRRLALSLLGQAPDLRPDERQAIAARLEDASPAVRSAAAISLAATAETGRDEAAAEAIASLLESQDPAEVVAGLEAAGRVPDCAASDAIAPHLRSMVPGVRAAAIRATSVRRDGEELLPTDALLAALEDEVGAVRRAAATALAARPGSAPGLMSILATGAPDAQDAALAAIVPQASELHEELLGWAHGQIDRAADLHRAHNALVAWPAERTAVRDFLADVIDQRAARAENRAIATLVAVGAPKAGGLMRRSLRSRDPDARAQAIEALDSLGDRRLGRALTACLEAVSDRAGLEPRAALDELAQDEDTWIATLARRLRARGGDTEDAEGGVPDERSAGLLDIMLLLRRVPLFAGLEPEDLQRIAMVAIEREYPAGTALMRQGAVDDELIVLAAGSVRVVQTSDGGEERFIRRYSAGEHIGELAILRDQPRVATVLAEDDVSGLVLGGDALRAILRERPEAAMAMLATLAERISTQ
jgi:HEAT repeat protein